jgi:D-alanyl-D-alanine carboxypeptidase
MTLSRTQIDILVERLGIDLETIAARGLPFHTEAEELVGAGQDILNRDQRLAPIAASAWKSMRESAGADSAQLLLVSGYRSFAEQAAIVERKLERGLALDAVLAGIAPPGYSEHHSGRAVDIATPGTPPLTESFENTPAYAWLCANAARFAFTLSFPRDNPYGYCFEPWHWCHRPDAA